MREAVDLLEDNEEYFADGCSERKKHNWALNISSRTNGEGFITEEKGRL